MPAGMDDDALFFERLKEEIARPPYHALLGVKALSASAREVKVLLPYRPAFSFSPTEHFFHGGVILSLIDLTAHAAIAVNVGHFVPTIDLRADFLRPAIGEDLIAVGEPLRVGRSIATADVKVCSAATGAVFAVGRGTFSSKSQG